MAEQVRLQRYLAAAGVAARRKAEELITDGRVTVNGAVVTVLGTKIDPEHDAVEVDGEAVVALDQFYVLFNKPKGCITAVTDDRGRPTVMDYLPNLPVPVKPVGRLDFYSEGVLLLTNDGELAARLLAPASHVPKTYHVKVHGRLERADLVALRSGITLDDGTTTLPAEVEILPGESKHTWLGVTIHEGKHRQIHRMIEALGHQVDKLQRVAFANLTFHELRVGDARELTQQELNELRDSVGLDHSSVARGRWRSRREETDIPRRARAKARAEDEAAASGPPPSEERASEGDAAAFRRDAPGAPQRRAADAGQASGTPAGGRAGHAQRPTRGEGPGERGGREDDAAPSGRGSGSRGGAYGGAPSGRGAASRGGAYGGAPSGRGSASRAGAYGGAPSGRGSASRDGAYGGAPSGRGSASRGGAYGAASSKRGAGRAYGTASSQRAAGRRGGAYGPPSSERGAASRGRGYDAAPSGRGAGSRGRGYDAAPSGRGAGSRGRGYDAAPSGRGAGSRGRGYDAAPSGRGAGRAYGTASSERGAGRGKAHGAAAGERKDRGPRPAPGAPAARGPGGSTSTRGSGAGSRRSPGGAAHGGFGPRVPRRGRPPK